MSAGTDGPPALDGDLHRLPFLAGELAEHAAPLFADLAAEYGVEDVLVVKRFPTETAGIAERFAAAADAVERPDVVGLSAHAARTLEHLEDPPRRLEGAERNLLLARFVDDREWEAPYLRDAAAHESFGFDVGRFVTEATWQGGDVDSEDPVLAELAEATDDYHDRLAAADALDPAMVLRAATDALVDPGVGAAVRGSFDAVLALEFEEFTPIDREYLARLAEDRRLVCVAEAESAIQRTWNEPGRIDDHVTGLAVTDGSTDGPSTLPDAVASFLATGDPPATPGAGEVAVIEGETEADGIAAIAQEIERLRRVEGVPYDEMAVVLRDSNAPIPETLRGLRTAGVPVASATVSGLEHDPVARELYALASWCVARTEPSGADPDGDIGWDEERARDVLESRVPELSGELLEAVRERGTEDGIAAALAEWLLETDLKHRVASSEQPLTAKTQFEHVRGVRSLAAAIDRSDLLEATWATFCEGLETELRRATSDKVATELDLPGGGVLVDAVRVAKNLERRVVFLPGVVDREYPAEPRFNSLFPTPHLRQLPAYPAFSTPDADDVRETFAFADGGGSRPLDEYYAALSRRLLAVGARAATERLYFGTYREADGSGQATQPSRFLDAVEEAVGDLERIEHDEVYTQGEAVRFALDGVESAVEDVRRGGIVGEPIDVAEVERDFASVQRLLASDPPAELAAAIEARIDFAEGAVRRE